jgi:hypothetical protein
MKIASLFVITHHPIGELLSRKKPDFIRLLSAFIRVKDFDLSSRGSILSGSRSFQIALVFREACIKPLVAFTIIIEFVK